MCKKLIPVYFIVLFFTFCLLSNSIIKAADMSITNLSPANGSVEICADTKLWITFATTPILGTSGKLQICRVADDNSVWDINLYSSLPNPPISTGWPAEYKITQNTRTVNYEPFAINGNTLEIYPSTRLSYNTAYYIKMTAGFCTDANGNTSPAITDNTIWHFTTKVLAPAADHDYTVAADGSGDFCTLQGAIDAVSNSDPCRTLIKIKKGTYREIDNIPSGKTNMTWLGEDRDSTILAAYNFDGFNSGSDYRMLIRDSASGHRYYNMTLHNLRQKAGGNNQAETIKHSGQQSIVKNCKFMSYQDTLCLNGQMYLLNSYIEGDVDYVWGYGTVYFDGCEMHTLTTKGYNTQPRQVAEVNGLIFVDCNLTSPGLTNCYLARGGGASYPYGQTVYINCTMPANQFYPVGWLLNGTDPCNLRFWEYKSVEPNGNPIDVSGRINPGSRQLTDDEAAHLRDVNNIFGTWNPKALGELPTPAWQQHPANGATGISPTGIILTWAAGAEATSHIVHVDTNNPPESIGEQTANSYSTGLLDGNTTYYWQIDEKNDSGITPGTVQQFTTALYGCTSHPLSDLDNNCQVDFFDFVLFGQQWAGTLDFDNLAQFALDWLACNRYPDAQCWK